MACMLRMPCARVGGPGASWDSWAVIGQVPWEECCLDLQLVMTGQGDRV